MTTDGGAMAAGKASRTKSRVPACAFAGIGLALALLALLLAIASPRFGYDVAVRDMPVWWLVAGLMLAGLIYLPLPSLIGRMTAGAAAPRILVWFMLGAGLAMRLVLLASDPVLEDDYQRYLWDGAVTAAGLNPYAAAPEAAEPADAGWSPLGRLAGQAGPVLDRVNHPHLKTIYPPVAQAAFALAHLLSPFSLAAWRLVLLGFELAGLWLLLTLLRDLGRSPLWAALYWWNPIAVKELANSAHMDAVVVCLVLAGLVLAGRRRLLAATGAVLLAAGAKIWPALLLPLIWRPLAARPTRLTGAGAVAAAAAVLFAAPMVSGGLDQSSGLVAYASAWKTNSALFPLLERIMGGLPGWIGSDALPPGVLARVAIALALGGLALGLAVTPFGSSEDLVKRALVMTAAVFLLSPAQFPWYYLWVLPLMACRPVWGLLLATATLPLYYSAFYFLARGDIAVFREGVVWLVWLPVWAVLLWESEVLSRLKTRLQRRFAPGAPRGAGS